jgi:hypothetical protein
MPFLLSLPLSFSVSARFSLYLFLYPPSISLYVKK